MRSRGIGTIPLELRERYGLGVDVDVVATEDGALARPAQARRRGLDLVVRLRDRADEGLDADAILRLTRSDEPA
jgi:hypothetical protein